jgi:uncharacterized protein (TIGR02598 family)
VEVVVALGVTSFALVAILGLFSLGLATGQKSSQSTALATMTVQVMGQLRGNTNSTINLTTNFYFDNQGNPTNQASAYFNCLVTTSSGNTPPINNLAGSFVPATIKFSWPASIPAASQSSCTNFASLPHRP